MRLAVFCQPSRLCLLSGNQLRGPGVQRLDEHEPGVARAKLTGPRTSSTLTITMTAGECCSDKVEIP